MKIEFSHKKRHWALAALAMVISLACGYLTRTDLVYSPELWMIVPILLGLGVGSLFVMRIEVRSWWAMILEQMAVAVIGMYLLHCSILEGRMMMPFGLAGSTCISLVILFAGFALTGSIKWVGAVWFTLCYGFGLVDTIVTQLRGSVIVLNDFIAIGTALSVVDNYTIQWTVYMSLATAAYLVAMAMIFRVREIRPQLKRLRIRLLALGCAALASWYPLANMGHRIPQTYGGNGVRNHGILAEFLLELDDMFIREPEGYSQARVAESTAPYTAEAASSDEEKPHIIAIMIEAFSDLSMFENFKTDKEPLPFLKEIAGESIHGYAMASIVGGRTSISEWEFLTGNSMAFLPAGSTPYQQYLTAAPNSVVRLLKNEGYHCIGMHPYYEGNWNRNVAYRAMGFDETYFMEDLEWDEQVRFYVSDRAFVHQIINLFEHRDDEKPMFFFGVTMQNHGGYDTEGFESDIHLEGLSKDYDEVEQYLTLTSLTDAALRELVDYFRNCDEKVQVIFFGDHQPRLTDEFYKEMGLKDSNEKYLVPYVIWNNYDSQAKEAPLSSMNYLAAQMLESAGVEMPPYFDYLNAMSQTIPAINGIGYVYDGAFYTFEEPSGEEAEKLIADYEILQYANMFDDAADPALFVGEKAAGTD